MNLSRFKIYLKQTSMMLQDSLIYRADFASRFIGALVRFGITAYLWIAILHSKDGSLGAYDVQQIMTYFLIMQIVTAFIFSSAQSGFITSSEIQSGDLSSRLIQPADPLLLIFSIVFGRSIFYFFANLVIFVLVVFLMPDYFSFNFTFIGVFLSIPIMLCAFIINYCFSAGIGLLSFWMGTSQRLIFHFFALVQLLSGMIMPIDLFPKAIADFLNYTPFPYIYYFPVKLLEGTLQMHDIIKGSLITVFYAIILYILTRLMYSRGIKSYEAVGR